MTLRDFTHVRDHVPAGIRADRAVKKFSAMVQVVLHGGAALRVPLALQPGFCAARAGSPREARLDGPLGACAFQVFAAAAVLQSRTAFGQVELD